MEKLGGEKQVSLFTDLVAWQKAHRLVLDVYALTKQWPKEEVFGVTSQIRRAVTSITANIAEGFDRYHFNDKVRFYHQARGSASEVQNFLFIARDLRYNNDDLRGIIENVESVKQLINGMIRSIRHQQ